MIHPVAETPNLVDGATMLPRSVNAMVRHQSKHNVIFITIKSLMASL